MPPPSQSKLTSLSSKHDVQLLNNRTASCLMLRRLHIKQTAHVGQT
jgi:hypothetical protein